MEAYLPIAVLGVIAIILCAGVYATSFLGPRNPLSVKLSPYECGVEPEGNARTPFKSRFYLIAVLFLLFDVEAAFLFPWALVYRDSIGTGPALLIAGLIYLFFMVLALVYVFRKKVLELN